MLIHEVVVDVAEGMAVCIAHIPLNQIIACVETERVVSRVPILEWFFEVVFHAFCFGSPAFSCILGINAAVASAVLVLHFQQVYRRVKGNASVVTNRAAAFSSGLCGDDDGSVSCGAAIEGCGRRTFHYVD